MSWWHWVGSRSARKSPVLPEGGRWVFLLVTKLVFLYYPPHQYCVTLLFAISVRCIPVFAFAHINNPQVLLIVNRQYTKISPYRIAALGGFYSTWGCLYLTTATAKSDCKQPQTHFLFLVNLLNRVMLERRLPAFKRRVRAVLQWWLAPSLALYYLITFLLYYIFTALLTCCITRLLHYLLVALLACCIWWFLAVVSP